MASTAMLEKKAESAPNSLDDMAVRATFTRHSCPSSSTRVVRLSAMYLHASLLASRKPEIMVVGCNLFLTRSFARLRSSAAMMTTEVVPSPTSLSCWSASSTKTFAAGCSTSRSLRIVAPSFVTVTSPISSTNILSKPTGPREDLTMLAIEAHAVTF
eukprot:Lithocolla_globosa_v1_NODE_2567_length_1950_cov_17.572559.p3 type:complete len:157 gc:universal NODE_2567_length_1950_cov_17.572559:1359-1829(+)